MAKPNLNSKVKEFYRVDSGEPSTENKDLGRSYYKLTCGDSNMFGFYENGEYILHARKCSIEKVGTDVAAVQKSHNDTETFAPSKIILAESGDIYLEAKGGDIIMKGNNIIMRADGSEDKEGHVFINANNTVAIEGANIDVQAMGSFKVEAKTGLALRGGSTLIAGTTVDISEGLGFSPGDFVSSIITGDLFSPQKFLQIFNNFLTSGKAK